MKRPILDEYDRRILNLYRTTGAAPVSGSLLELDLALLKLKREVCGLLLTIHKILKNN